MERYTRAGLSPLTAVSGTVGWNQQGRCGMGVGGWGGVSGWGEVRGEREAGTGQARERGRRTEGRGGVGERSARHLRCGRDGAPTCLPHTVCAVCPTPPEVRARVFRACPAPPEPDPSRPCRAPPIHCGAPRVYHTGQPSTAYPLRRPTCLPHWPFSTRAESFATLACSTRALSCASAAALPLFRGVARRRCAAPRACGGVGPASRAAAQQRWAAGS